MWTVYLARVNRYESIRLCETCNVLYDAEGHSERANRSGFHSLMTMASNGAVD